MNPFPAQKSTRAVLGTLAFLIIWHLLFQEPGRPLSKIVPGLLMLLLGELIREWVVAHTPASDDEEVREQRQRWRLMAAAGFLLSTGTFIALAYYDLMAPGSLVGYVLIFVLVASGGIFTGLTLNDTARMAATASHEARATSASVMKVLLFVLTVLVLGIVGYEQYATWQDTGSFTTLARIKIGAALVAAAYFNIMIWRSMDRELGQSAAHSPEASNG